MENSLESLSGLECLAGSLTNLNAAKNNIQTLSARNFSSLRFNEDGTVRHISSLECLNLAANRLCLYADLLEIAKIPGDTLVDVSFFDPDWGGNPVCSLPNYEPFALRYLGRRLKLFDQMELVQVGIVVFRTY